jgi:hypothetical protein
MDIIAQAAEWHAQRRAVIRILWVPGSVSAEGLVALPLSVFFCPEAHDGMVF